MSKRESERIRMRRPSPPRSYKLSIRTAALGLVVLVSVLVACASGSGPATTQAPAVTEFNIIGWGGPYGDALTKWVSEQFESAHNVTVLLQEQAVAADSLAKLQAEQADPTIDVWLTTGALPLLLAQSGGLEELSEDLVPNLADLFPVSVQRFEDKAYGAGIHLGAELIIVDRDRIKDFIPDYNIDMLKSWKFLYRPELKDQIAIAGFGAGFGGFMIGMSMPYGGSENDEEAFFAAMEQLAPNVHTIPEATYVPLFQSKEVVASMGTPVDALELVNSGANVDIGYPLDPLEIFLDYIVAIKNGPAGRELALEFVNQILEPEVMTGYDGELGFASPNSQAEQPTIEGVPPLRPEDVLENGWLPDFEVAIANYDAWNERFQQEIVPLFGG